MQALLETEAHMVGLDTNISKSVPKIYPEILNFFPKKPLQKSINIPKSF